MLFAGGFFQFPAHGHVEEHPLPGLVDAQGLALLVDVGDHLLGRQLRIDLEVPHAAQLFLETLEQVVGEKLGAGGGEGDPKNGVDAGGHEVMADGDGLFSSSTPGAAPAAGRSLMSVPRPPALTQAVAAMRMRELSTQEPMCSTGGMPTVSQTSASPGPQCYTGRFRGQQPDLARGHGGAAGGQDDDVVLQQLLDHGEVGVVVHGAAVVAAHHAGHAPDPAVDDVVVQGVVGAPDGAAQQVLDGLVAEAHHRGMADGGDQAPAPCGWGSCRWPPAPPSGPRPGHGARQRGCAWSRRSILARGSVVMSLVW